VPAPATLHADVQAVAPSDVAGAYNFAVTVKSPETGCDRYADWWEVLDTDGSLLYRRILEHSHPGEQPFTRDGGPVTVKADQEVVVRAHMAPGGYGGQAMRGTAGGTFAAWAAPPGFGDAAEKATPQPPGCAF
jgi:hypothetical protein